MSGHIFQSEFNLLAIAPIDTTKQKNTRKAMPLIRIKLPKSIKPRLTTQQNQIQITN